MRSRLVLEVITACLRRGVWPGNFFQLNAPFFNETKGVFSKLEIDDRIPNRWRLDSLALSPQMVPEQWEQQIHQQFSFPLFLKPEWGQNSHGIFRVDQPSQLRLALEQVAEIGMPYFCQEAARYPREFEVFSIASQDLQDFPRFFSVTESQDLHGQQLPIHSVLNGTRYVDQMALFTEEKKQRLWQHVRQISPYRMARCALRANSLEELIEGQFQVVEINLFLPMPLSLLDESLAPRRKHMLMKAFSAAIAESVKGLDAQHFKPIFWRKTRRHFSLTRRASFQKIHQHSS